GGLDTEHLGVGLGPDMLSLIQRLSSPADLDAARVARPRRIIHYEGHTAVLLGVAELLALAEEAPADVYRVQCGVVAEADGDDIWIARRVDGCQVPEPLAREISDLRRCKHAQFSPPVLRQVPPIGA